MPVPSTRPRHLAAILAACLTVAVAASALAAPAKQGKPAGIRVSHAYGWHPLTQDDLIVWFGVEEPYRVELESGCADVRQVHVTGITSRSRHLLAHRDELLGTGWRCRIQSIRRADPAALKDLGIRLGDALPLRLINLAPVRKAK